MNQDKTESPIVTARENMIDTDANKSVAMVRQLINNNAWASASGGEMVFIQTGSVVGTNSITLVGPVKYLFGSVKSLIKGFQEVLKNKKKLIPAIVLAVFWLFLTLLPLLGINSFQSRLLSFLTFAGGGIGVGLLGAVGGVIGKGFFAYFIFAVIWPILSGKKSSAGKVEINKLIEILTLKNPNALIPLFLGAGTALIANNFLTGNASLQNSMAGIVAFVLSLRAFFNKNGFLRGFIQLVVHKFNQAKVQDIMFVNRIMAGFTTGFAFSLLLSVTKISVIGYLAGIIMIVAASILGITFNRNKEVAQG